MKTTDILRREHELISTAIDLVDAAVSTMAHGGVVPRARAAELVSVLQVFAERCHHPKEQGVLFPALAAHGVSRQTGVLHTMTAERERARKYLIEMADSSPYIERSPEARARFCTAATACTTLLRAHVGAESDVLFPLAESLVGAAEDQCLAEQFAADTLEPAELQRLRKRLLALTTECGQATAAEA